MRFRHTRGSWIALLGLAVVAGLLGGDPGKPTDAERIAALIKQLGDDAFARREEASRGLEALGEKALPALKTVATTGEELEVRRRAQRAARVIMLTCRKAKSIGLTMQLIDPGEFQMGSGNNEGGRRTDETLHGVQITRPFLLGTYEVTQDEYKKLMEANPSWFSDKGGGKDKVAGKEIDRFPVERVTWYDALEFCNKLSKGDGYEPYYKLTDVKREDGSIVKATVTVAGGNGFRLPTEAEWEYGCRAGSKMPYHFGGAANGHKSNVKGETYSGGYGGTVVGPNLERTTKVGSYPANELGLYDMHGNAAEWCWDWYDKDYYGKSPKDDPQGPDTGTQRVQRGGSWLVSEGNSRSASRIGNAPEEKKDYAGFRVARTP